MTALGQGATVEGLIPGNPAGLRTTAAVFRRYGTLLTDTGEQLARITARGWTGKAAEAFDAKFREEPKRWSAGGQAYLAAANAIDEYATVLTTAQQQAAQAAAEYAAGRQQDAQFQPGGQFGALSPGEARMQAAQALLAQARDDVSDAARRATAKISAARDQAPARPTFGEELVDLGSEIGAGLWESTRDLFNFAAKLDPARIWYEPDEYLDEMGSLLAGLAQIPQHPTEFVMSVTDWETWKESPGRAIGHLVPDLLLALSGGKTLKAGRAEVALAEAEQKLAELTHLGDELQAKGWLGADTPPTSGEVGRLTQGYDKYGGLTREEFLQKYWDPTARDGQGGWRYPPNDGFDGPRVPYTPQVGELFDRFGSPAGEYLSPQGAKFSERALPPGNLNPQFDHHGYRVYEVIKPWDSAAGQADLGRIAPAFEQPGGGTQLKTSRSVQWLLDNDYIRDVTDKAVK